VAKKVKAMKKEAGDITSSSFKRGTVKKRCGAPYTHHMGFYECLWNVQPKSLKKHK
jgi:hypothetical protein